MAGVLALVASSTVFLIPWIFRSLQRALTGHDVRQITWMILAFLGVTLLEICVSAGIRRLQSLVSIQLNRDLLLRYYGKILNLAVEDFIAFRQRTNLFQRIIDAMSVTGSFTTILIRGGQVAIAAGVLAAAIAMLSPAVLGVLALGSAVLFGHVSGFTCGAAAAATAPRSAPPTISPRSCRRSLRSGRRPGRFCRCRSPAVCRVRSRP